MIIQIVKSFFFFFLLFLAIHVADSLFPTFAQVIPQASIKLGTGFADNVPRQIVRANNDRVYVFGAVVQTTRVIKVYWSNSGFPTSQNDFPGSAQTSTTSEIISVDAIYDGNNIIHVLANDMSNVIKDYPFDITTNTFKPPLTIATSTGKPQSYTDIGTTGVSGMFDKLGTLHIAYWTSQNTIMYKSYTYNESTNALNQTSGPTRLDTSGNANHPQLVTSPIDNSITVAWVNGQNGPGTMSARSKPSNGSWGSIEQINTSPVWTSPNSGINIDQGPSIVITSDNTRHIIYMENFGSCGSDYGRIHYVKKGSNDSSWSDQSITNFCSHAPGIATNANNELFIMGHGYPQNPSCTSMLDMCYVKRNTNGTWTNPVVFQTHTGSDSLDASASIRWSAVGWNRPEIVEFLFFVANSGSYQNTNLWYGRLAGNLNTTSPTPSLTPTPPLPTITPTPTPPTITKIYSITDNNRDAWSGAPRSGGSTHEVRISGFDSTTEPYEFVSNDSDAETAGLQFQLDIPKNAMIQNAFFTVTGVEFENPSPTGGMAIHLYDVGNAQPFTNGFLGDLLNHHPTMSQTILWSDPTVWILDTQHNSPNITSLLQTHINRADYTPGNYVGFAITAGTIQQGKYYGWKDSVTGQGAKLTVTYSLSQTITPTPTLTPSLTTIPVKPGDCEPDNGDSDVDIFDYNRVVSNFGSSTNLSCDFVNPGTIDIFDYNIVVSNFGT